MTVARRYPNAWKQVDSLRGEAGQRLTAWPPYVFLPSGGMLTIVLNQCGKARLGAEDQERRMDVDRLGALAAWRVTQGIYRFDPTLFDALIDTPVTGQLPSSVLHHLPEWCIYVETPGRTIAGHPPLYGFFAHLDFDLSSGREALRLALDSELGLGGVFVYLGEEPLSESVRQVVKQAEAAVLAEGGAAAPRGVTDWLTRLLEPLVSLVLYLCSVNAELGCGTRRPAIPIPKKTKKGLRHFPAERPTIWDVGVRLGAALRQAQEAQGQGEAAGALRNGPCPHIRRAHWHAYWSGPKRVPQARKVDLKWLPPIPVNLELGEELPASIHRVLASAVSEA